MVTKKKNIFLHIGLCKTGTTAIQNTLQLLQKSGELKKVGFQAHSQENLYYLHLQKMYCRENEEFILKKFHEEIYRYGNKLQDNIVLSQEVFSLDIHDGKIIFSGSYASFFHKVFEKFNVKIIIYLRRQDQMLESMYAQWLKNGEIAKEDFAEKALQHSLYYKSILDEYGKYFGKDNIIVRIYDKRLLFKNDIVSDFMQIIGLEHLACPKQNHHVKNSSFSPEALRIRFAFDEKYRLHVYEQQACLEKLERKYLSGGISKVDYALEKHSLLQGQKFEITEKYATLQPLFCLESLGNFSNAGFMQVDERRAFLAQYEEDNAAIAREYCGREDGKLFNDIFPENIISLDAPSATDVITIFLPIIQNLHVRTLRAEEQLAFIKAPWKLLIVLAKKIFKKLKSLKDK